MPKILSLFLMIALVVSFVDISYASDKSELNKFQQYEQQDREYSNPKGYMLPPVMYAAVPYMSYDGYNNTYDCSCNDIYYNYHSDNYVSMPYIWFNPVDFAGDTYNDSQRKSKSTLVKTGEYTIDTSNSKE